MYGVAREGTIGAQRRISRATEIAAESRINSIRFTRNAETARIRENGREGFHHHLSTMNNQVEDAPNDRQVRVGIDWLDENGVLPRMIDDNRFLK